MKKLNVAENILLATLFIIIPFFLGLSSNTGIMLWQLITLLLANIKLLKQSFIECRFQKPGILEILLISLSLLAVLHFFFSANRYNSFILLLNILFLTVFSLFYLRYLSKDEFNKIRVFFLAGFLIQVILSSIQFIMNPTEPVKGGFLDPNYFAVYLIIGALLILGTCLFNKIPKKYKIIGYSLTVVLLLLIIATQSRSAAGLFLLAATFLLLLKKPRFALIGIAVIIFLVFLPNPYKSKIKEVHHTDPYAYTRLKIYQMDIEIFADYFIFGVGMGCFQDHSPMYNFPVEGVPGRYRVTPEQAHNSYLHWAVEMGTVGLIPLLMILSYICRNIYFNLIRIIKTKEKDTHFNPGVDIAILVIMAMGMLHNVFYNNSILLLFAFLVFYSDLFSRQRDKKKVQLIKIQPLSKNSNKYLFSAIWIIAFLSTWYFMIHTSWLSTVYFNRGVDDIDRSDLERSIKHFDNALKILPFYSKAWLYKADVERVLFIKSSNVDYALSALQSYDKGLEYAERSGDLQMDRISTLISLENLIKSRNSKMIPSDLEQEIEAGFARLFVTHPKRIFYYHDYAVYEWQNGHIEVAENVLLHTLNLEPNYIPAHVLLATIYEKKGDMKSAEKHKTQAVRIAKRYDYRRYANDYYLYNLLKWE